MLLLSNREIAHLQRKGNSFILCPLQYGWYFVVVRYSQNQVDEIFSSFVIPVLHTSNRFFGEWFRYSSTSVSLGPERPSIVASYAATRVRRGITGLNFQWVIPVDRIKMNFLLLASSLKLDQHSVKAHSDSNFPTCILAANAWQV